MIRRLTFLVILVALASGVMSGMPLHTPNDMKMKCCDKAKNKVKMAEANASQLCCAVNCTEPGPTTSNASFNSSPSSVTISKSIAEQIADLFPARKDQLSVSPQYSREVLLQTFHPKYIQHNSLLI